jgi:hypothetical protein
MAGSITPSSLGVISNQAADKIVAALNRNTAALLTVAAEMVAFSLANRNETQSPDQTKEQVMDLFNLFLTR